ncbi:MAG TPA: arginine--tRNA ligase, partial [Planctomycetota bacterium]|nr:arginine--tRNA ligase [Planctomycetota bacterium]
MSLESSWSQAVRASAKRLWSIDLEGTLLEPPADPKYGDATCNAAMRLAKQLKKPPRAIAEELAAELRKSGVPHLAKVEVAGAGFVNLTAAPEFFQEELKRVLAEGSNYGRSPMGGGRKVLVEHCSANPTGPLHIAHGRQAAVGDSLANVLDFAGFKVGRDFYINDTGNQIDMLGRSILWRMYEAEGRTFTEEQRGVEIDEETKKEIPLVWAWTQVDGRRFEILLKNAYKGDYIKALVAELQAQGGAIDLERAKRYGKDRLLEEIKKDLEAFRVRYDTWVSEETLHKSGKVDEVLNFFNSWGLTYSKNGATYLKTSAEGDPEDRPIVKADGGYVYRLPDMAYHKDKFERGFDILIDLWGPDHHAHIATMQAGLKLLKFNLTTP